MAARIWSGGRKWMGNLVPLLCMLPFASAAVGHILYEEEITWLGVGLGVSGLVVGWLAVNQFGFFGNAKLKREIVRTVLSKAGRDASEGVFVGFARPAYVGLLDAHEDLGFLFLDKEKLEYIGELHHVTLPRADILGVRFRWNVHSTLGLGRWVSIDARHQGKPIRVLVEPREARTLLGNRRRGSELRKRIEEWRK